MSYILDVKPNSSRFFPSDFGSLSLSAAWTVSLSALPLAQIMKHNLVELLDSGWFKKSVSRAESSSASISSTWPRKITMVIVSKEGWATLEMMEIIQPQERGLGGFAYSFISWRRYCEEKYSGINRFVWLGQLIKVIKLALIKKGSLTLNSSVIRVWARNHEIL